MAALRRHGFQVPEQLLRLNGSNVERNKHYDQIAFMKRDDRFEGTGKAGIIDLYKVLYRAGASQVEGDESAYRPLMKRSWKFKEWRTHQLSDHLPMWVELKINFTPAYLDELIHAK